MEGRMLLTLPHPDLIQIAENDGKRFNTNKMFEYRIEERFRGYFLRVGYTQTLDRSMDPLINTLPKVICRTFIPIKREDGEHPYENITEVIERIGMDLKTTGGWSL